MKLFDKLVPFIVIILVCLLAYLLYQNKYAQEEINVPLNYDNLNEQFSYSKKELDSKYVDESYNDKIDNLNVTCYHELKRCYEFENNAVKSIVLLKGNKNNSFNNISNGNSLDTLNLKIEKIKSKEDCYINEINEKYNSYEINYLSKENCDDDDQTIDKIIIINNDIME